MRAARYLVVMAQRTTPDRRGSLADPPSQVQVTVVPGPHGAVRGRLAHLRRVLRPALFAGLAVTAAAVGTVLLVVGRNGHAARASGDVRIALSRAAAPPGVAAVYRYPLGCLGVTLSAADPAYASAHLDRGSPCWRYGVYVTAIFHRVDGVWRLMLEATSATCPPVSLPAAVRAALAVCQREATRRSRLPFARAGARRPRARARRQTAYAP